MRATGSHSTSLAFGSLRAPLARRLRPEPAIEGKGDSGAWSEGRRGKPPSRSIPRTRPLPLGRSRGIDRLGLSSAAPRRAPDPPKSIDSRLGEQARKRAQRGEAERSNLTSVVYTARVEIAAQKAAVRDAVDAARDELSRISTAIHARPELAFE